ncbi:MAG TPA: hypothetical protein PKA35_05555, partial [Paracoccus solventivorans]|nr:hypothetical protein [Paracoccus solventivorans]
MTQHQRLLIIDFGSQVTQLIARRLRELGVFCEIRPYQSVTDAELRETPPQAVILSGGPDSVTRDGSPRARERGSRPWGQARCHCRRKPGGRREPGARPRAGHAGLGCAQRQGRGVDSMAVTDSTILD